jgi:hypothetical protein
MPTISGLTYGRGRKYFFLEKTKQKPLLCNRTRMKRRARNEESKSFLVLFFKKELLPWHLAFLS